jgi:tetratricopeptide (TPR) repeat protein
VRSYQWNEAIQILQKGLGSYPDDAGLLAQLGGLLVRSGQVSPAQVLLARASALDPDNAEIVRDLGEVKLRLGQFPAAVQFFRKSIGLRPGDGESCYRLAFAFFLNGELKEALNAAQQAVDLNPTEPAYRDFYALLLDQKGESQESYQQLRTARRLAPRDPQLLFRLGEKQKLEGRFNQAVEYFEQASQLDAENPLYHAQLSQVYSRLGLKTLAEKEAARNRQLLQAFQEYAGAVAQASRGLRTEAARHMESVLARNPEFITGMIFLAGLYRRLGEEKKALELYLRVLERNPSESSAIEEGAWLQLKQGSLAAAAELLKRLHQESPNQALVEGYRNLVQESWTAALAEFKKAEARMPLNPALLRLISFCLRAEGKRDEALAYLDKASQFEPPSGGIRREIREIKLEYAFHLLENENLKAALKAFTDLTAEDGLEASYFLSAAYCRQRLGDLAGAIRDYRTGLIGNPQAVWARANLAIALSQLSRYREAASEWEALLGERRVVASDRSVKSDAGEAAFGNEGNFDRALAYCQLGLCYSRLERFAEAELAFQKALQRGKETPEILYNLGVLYLRRNSSEEGWNLLNRSARAGYHPAKRLMEQAAQRMHP